MSGNSTYQPQGPCMRWLERRLPIAGLIHSSFIVYPVPRNVWAKIRDPEPGECLAATEGYLDSFSNAGMRIAREPDDIVADDPALVLAIEGCDANADFSGLGPHDKSGKLQFNGVEIAKFRGPVNHQLNVRA